MKLNVYDKTDTQYSSKKSLLAQTSGANILFSTSSYKLFLLVSSSIIIMSELSFSCDQIFFHSPFSCFLILFYSSSKDVEEVVSHEKNDISKVEDSLKINTCKFKKFSVSGMPCLFHFLITLWHVFVSTGLSYK